MEKRKIPEIRFRGFSGEWEEKKYDEILTVNYGKDYKLLGKGEIPIYGTGGIIDYVDEYISREDSVGLGRKGTIDKPIKLNHPFWTVDTLFFIEKKENTSILFIYNLLSTINWKKYDESTGVPSLSKKSIINVKSFIPQIHEQEKIGRIFESIDNMIEAQTKLIEENKKLKKSLLQKMFPKKGEQLPEIRLKGFSGEWEEKRLGSICEINKGTQLDKSEVDENGKYYHLNGGKEPSNFTNKWNVEENTISISEGGNSCGYVNWNKEKFFSGGHNYTLKAFIDIDLFLFQLLKSRESEIMRLRVGSGLPNIQKKDLSNYKVLIPFLPEQEAIGNLFKSLDEKIEMEEKKLETYKSLKKALLQKMFV